MFLSHLYFCSIFGKSQVGTDIKEFTKGLNLLDDSELEDSSLPKSNLPSPSTDVPLRASKHTDEDCTLLTRQVLVSYNKYFMFCIYFTKYRSTEEALVPDEQMCTMQGCVRRKTILKDGRKPAVSSWQRYWIQIWASSLAYFSPKTFKG